MFERFRTLLRENRRLWSVVAAAFITLIVAVWGIWGGFSLEIGQFFAANDITPRAILGVTVRNESLLNQLFNPLDLPGIPDLTNCGPGKNPLLYGSSCDGTIEYNLVWTTNLENLFPSSTGIVVECLPVAAPDDVKNKQFFSDIAGMLENGSVGSRPGADWIFVRHNLGVVRIELGKKQTPSSFRIECKASKADYAGGKLTATSWYSNTICLPYAGPDSTCKPAEGGTGTPPPLPAAGVAASTSPTASPTVSTASCGSLGGLVCDGRETGGCRSGYVDVGRKTTDCDSGFGFCCGTAATIASAATPTPAAATPATPGATSTPAAGQVAVTIPRCSPVNQTVGLRQPAILQATGGNGVTYTWDYSGGGTLEEGGNRDIVLSWRTPGQKVARVTSGGMTSEACFVFVPDVTPTPTAIVSGGGALTIAKTVQNITTGGVDGASAVVAAGQRLVFTIRITNTSSAAVTELTVRDGVPRGMSYVSGSTRVENQGISSNTLTTDAGLVLGTLNAGDPVTVQWTATADQSGLLQPGLSNIATATITYAGGGVQTAGITVAVAGTFVSTPAPIAGVPVTTPFPTAIPTGTTDVATAGAGQYGPSGSALAALAAAALASLLYAAYTRSPYFRKQELKNIGGRRDPLDFQG